MATMKTMATVKSYENEVNENYSITIKKNWNDAHNNKQTTKQNTNDDVDLDDCVAYMHWVCTHCAFVPQLWLSHTSLSMAQVLSDFTLHPWCHPHGASSLTRPLPSFFTVSSCPSPSSSSIPSCSLSSTTRSSWQVCATPLQKRVRTPWTPSPLTHKLQQQQKFLQIYLKNKRHNRLWRFLQPDQRRKQNHKEENLLMYGALFRWMKESGLILNEENLLSLRTRFRRK